MSLIRKLRHGVAILVSMTRVWYYRLMGVEIGKKTTISMGAHIDVTRGQIIIGERVSISHGVYILSHTGFQKIKEGEKTIIEDGVRIFVNSVILPGARIGKNSIIGAGSVVTKDVPMNVIVMGNPARVIQHLDFDTGTNSDKSRLPDPL